MANQEDELKLIRISEVEATATNWLVVSVYSILQNHGHSRRPRCAW